jgi:predicted ArsR family transcriptional regulator
MIGDLDLFGFLAPEPAPVTTRRESYESAVIHASRHRAMILECLRECGPRSADEIAAKIGLSILSTRPRVSELAKAHDIEPTGERRINDTGKSATVWRLVDRGAP